MLHYNTGIPQMIKIALKGILYTSKAAGSYLINYK